MKVVLKTLENVESANQSWFEEAKSHITISNKWIVIINYLFFIIFIGATTASPWLSKPESIGETGLFKHNLYKLQQRLLNPENIPRKKKTSLYRVSSRHLELWIEDTFVRNFDQHAFDALAFAWSRAKRDNLPFMAACNVHFKKHKIKPTPIKFHGTRTLTSHIKMTYRVEHYLPMVAPLFDSSTRGPPYPVFSKRRFSSGLLQVR
ncbi:kinase-like domain-containing protein [Rhizophagus irregularis DAOM 181602=DAOM 197198]|nr:kinase-like domain-containing protein [Rhizophagus irregularis DAOM 181602=DAOM 197198]